jgi:rhamnose utilization protein RhaD (predicted bifunctional aldolase and dehydrogenase)
MGKFKMEVNNEFNEFCGRIGSNRLLVQGGGGNVSWKDESCLWVKASGTRIGDALTSDIFVPVNLELLRQEISAGNFDALPVLLTESCRRPSIETMFHGILPQKYVVHLHEINSLSRLVGREAKNVFQKLMPAEFKWSFVDYHKPGPELARAIHRSSDSLADLDFIFLKNHGLIVADDGLGTLNDKLEKFSKIFSIEPFAVQIGNLTSEREIPKSLENEFSWVMDPDIEALAIDPSLLHYVENNWVMYPDHAVFLGPKACIAELGNIDQQNSDALTKNSFIFVPRLGVLRHEKTTVAELDQLLCYSDVLRRIHVNTDLRNLEYNEVLALLDWDAEKYRQSIAR